MRSRTLQMTFTALFAALIAVLTLIPLPFSFLGVPMTLQTFAVALCGFLLGWKLGIGSVALYIFLGLLGLPVFSGLRGGFQQLVGPTGGFLYGFLLLALFCGLSPRLRHPVLRRIVALLFGIAGLFSCHFLGVLQLSFVNHISFWAAVQGASLPFLPKDLVSVALAFGLAVPIRKRLSFLQKPSEREKF